MNLNLNISKLIEDTLPSFLRNPNQRSWFGSLTAPIASLKSLFLSFVAETNERLQWNGQTIVLRKLLRDRFDDQGIEITNTNKKSRPFYVYGVGDSRNPHVNRVGDPANPIAGEPNSYDLSAVDFVVNVPFQLNNEQTEEMKALINAYKVYSKRFKIEDQP